MKSGLLIFVIFAFTFSDTIPNTTGSCLNHIESAAKIAATTGESFNLLLSNDTLSFWGIIRHNCCGGHFLESKISNDTVYLSRIDTGMLCRCDCPFPFSIKLPKLTKNQYRIKLTNYSSYGLGLDTLIGNSTVTEHAQHSNTKLNLSCVPNPANSSINIKLYGSESEPLKVDIYDLNGKLYTTLFNGKSGVWTWLTRNVAPGTYLVRYNGKEQTVSSKIVIQ